MLVKLAEDKKIEKNTQHHGNLKLRWAELDKEAKAAKKHYDHLCAQRSEVELELNK